MTNAVETGLVEKRWRMWSILILFHCCFSANSGCRCVLNCFLFASFLEIGLEIHAAFGLKGGMTCTADPQPQLKLVCYMDGGLYYLTVNRESSVCVAVVNAGCLLCTSALSDPECSGLIWELNLDDQNSQVVCLLGLIFHMHAVYCLHCYCPSPPAAVQERY